MSGRVQRESKPSDDPSKKVKKDMDFITNAIFNLHLTWRLFWDKNVRLILKSIPIGFLIYVVSPIDFFSEAVFGPIGVVDDAAVVAGGITLFCRLCKMFSYDAYKTHKDYLDELYK